MKKILTILIILVVGFLAYSKLKNNPTPLAINTENLSKENNVESEGISVLEQNKAYCFIYSHKSMPDEPYEVSEEVKITRMGERIEGVKRGTQSGSDMTNGFEGTLSGNYSEGEIFLTYDYQIEGSNNKELEVYYLQGRDLIKKRYPLTEGVYEGQKMLVPDQSQEFKALTYSLENCL